jgi:hypothetical protein
MSPTAASARAWLVGIVGSSAATATQDEWPKAGTDPGPLTATASDAYR